MVLNLFTVALVASLINGCFSCGGIFQQSNGILRSPVSGNKIGKITRCDYVLLVPPDQRLKVVFVDLVLKTTCCSCKHDYIELRDGKDINSTLIGRYCAQNIPKYVYSTRNELWIRFESDFRTSSENRFKLTFDTTCGRHFNSLTGSFSSHGSTYKPNLECIYTISVPRGRLKVSFTVFDLEGRSSVCEFDFIEVKEIHSVELASEGSASHKRRFCGKEKPPTIYSTIGGFLWFRFKTDSNRQNSGFSANFRTVSVGEGSCNRELTSEKGFIYSKNYPFSYPRNTECTWNIKVDPTKHVHLTFDTFNFSSSSAQSCKYGHVSVYDDVSLKFRIGQFCGPSIPRIIVSRSNVLTLRSVSSNIQNTGWFSIRYKTSDEGPCGLKKFTCESHKCIEAHHHCDGNKNCVDGSDEKKCPTKESKLSWYSFWPVTVVIVMLFMGIWLWRTWRKFVTPQSDIEVRYCASPCHHHSNRGVTEILEPPSYNEAISNRPTDIPPPTYEEAINSQPIPYIIITSNVDGERQDENSSMNRIDASTVTANTVTKQRSDRRRPLTDGVSSVNSLGQPYTSHRAQDRTNQV